MRPIASLAKLAAFITAIGAAVFFFYDIGKFSTTKLAWAIGAFVGVCGIFCLISHFWRTHVSKVETDERTKRGLLAIGSLCVFLLLAASLFGQAREGVVIESQANNISLSASNTAYITHIKTLQEHTTLLVEQLQQQEQQLIAFDKQVKELRNFAHSFHYVFCPENEVAPKDLKATLRKFAQESHGVLIRIDQQESSSPKVFFLNRKTSVSFPRD